MRKRVVITGMGAITPLGNSVDALYRAQLAGKSGVGPIEHFNASQFPTKFAAQVRNFNLADHVREPGRWKAAGANSRFAAAAAHHTLEDAGLLHDAKVDRNRFGVYIGAGEGIHDFHNFFSLVARNYDPQRRRVNTAGFAAGGLKDFHPPEEFEQELHTTTGHLGAYFDLRGPNYTCLTACAASSQAIGEAAWQIRHGDADLVLAGGSHSMIHPLGVTGFNRLTALSTRNDAPQKASRPFDRDRDGFVLGEGAAMLILEELEHARKRGAKIYAELTGYGTTGDAFAVTDSHETGRGAIACIEGALRDSGMSPSAIGYINAHGTSTQVNDRVETLAIKKVFGDGAYQIPISSSKSMIGHLIAAAGAVELIVSIMALRNGVLPPTINYETPDSDCDLDYIPNVAREKKVRHVLSNSFGFGGQNISLIVSEFN
ncbi:MAG TPA: beta-ketoacyl-[acyl-carrier-protein] synthase family protein [Gemmataceae bacterium]|nr:beta-ketoacyl-[acyl-carrier-protein] synthase family protein [Gemmataceae bacterium]